MKSKIELSGVKTYAFHGCMDSETKIGAYYKTDVCMEVDILSAAQNDELYLTINYAVVNDIIIREMAIPSHLIENVCYRIFNAIKNAFPQVEHLSVKISKLSPPVSGAVDSASVQLSE